jgi:hypothetical protein
LARRSSSPSKPEHHHAVGEHTASLRQPPALSTPRDDIIDFPKPLRLPLRPWPRTQKAAKVSLDGSCRCVCVEVLRRAVLERSPCSLLFGRTRPSMRPVGALPLCRANDPRSLSHVTGGDALQASDAVPFDEMAKAGFQLSALRSSSAIKITTDPPQRPRAKLSKSSIRGMCVPKT